MNLVPLLSRLIAARSPNPGGDERALADLLAVELRARGGSVVVGELPRASTPTAWVMATWGTPTLLVNVHLDTVPPNDGWTSDPFVARVTDDRVYGLGAADIKGAIAAILCALDREQPRNVAVLFSGDEELDNGCMRRLLESDVVPKTVTRAIVCEPTSMRVGTRHRGILSLEVALRGKGGHSSRADTLPRPIAELARIAVALDEWGRAHVNEGPPGFPGMCLNIAKLDGGVAFNVVPERAVLTVSLRPPPGSDSRAIRAQLERIVGIETTWLLDNPSFATRELASFGAITTDRDVVDLGFWTEAALLSRAGIDAIVIGPGDIGHAHAPDEHVPIADLHAACDLFTDVFRRS